MSEPAPEPSSDLRSASDLRRALARSRLLPVLTVADPEVGPPLAEALLAGGLTVAEITLRTEAALEVVEAMASSVPELMVGAGTIRTPEDLDAAVSAGARFAVSPGLTPRLAAANLAAGKRPELPLIPGVATAGEAMTAADAGFGLLKFFPAATAGGPATLRQWGAPLPDLAFCPTGGIDGATAPAYLELDNVVCVGGSWMVPAGLLAARDWSGISRGIRQALGELDEVPHRTGSSQPEQFGGVS